MLTHKQYRLLVFINSKLRETLICPSYREMADGLGLKSKSGIHRMIGELEKKGFLRRVPGMSRAVEITRLPNTTYIDG